MKFLLALVCAGGTVMAQAPKVALVNFQEAIVSTSDGREAEKRLDERFGPRKAKLDVAQAEIGALANQLKKEGLSEEDRAKINQQMEEKASALDDETDKADTDLKSAQDEVVKQLGPKMVAAAAQYAKDHGYAIVFDISFSDVPRFYAPNATDITKEVAAAYDRLKAHK